MNRDVIGVGITLLVVSATFGCTASWYAESADREVDALLTQRTRDVLGDREGWVIPTKPAVEKAPTETGPAEAGQAEADEGGEGSASEGEGDGSAAEPTNPNGPFADIPREVDLATALQTAVRLNRDYLTRQEGLYLQGLGTTSAKFNFGPQLNANVNPFAFRTEGGPTTEDLFASLSASQILPTGGDVSVSSDYSNDNLGKSFGLALNQPLMRGFGYEASHESLTQAQRSLVYEIRDFELFRQDFSIGVARQYFDLVSQRRTLTNNEANVAQAKFDREKAEALFNVGRNDEQDIFRARRREIEQNDDLIDAKARYQRATDDFKITMGLPTSIELDVVDADPPFEPIRVDIDSAIEAAQHNRLDLITQRDLVDDARRAVRIADNGLLPDVNLDLSGTFDDSAGTNAEGTWSGRAGVSIELPLQRTPERNSYRSAVIGLERAQRQLSLQLDRLELDIRDQLRQLDSTEQRIILQREQIEQQRRAVTVNEFQYERGDLEIRELLDARQSLVDAQNALIQFQTDHFIRRLTLLRDLGLLFVDDNGEWR